METLHLTTFGTSRQPLEQLLLEAAACYRSSQRQRTGVWSVDQVRLTGVDWGFCMCGGAAFASWF